MLKSDLQRRRERLKQELEEAEGELEDAKYEVDCLESRLYELQEELTDLNEEEELNKYSPEARLNSFLDSKDPLQLQLS